MNEEKHKKNKVISYNIPEIDSAIKNLEDFPHIIKNLQLFWGTQEFYEIVDNILFANRYDRNGLPKPTFTTLLNICEIHKKKFPKKETVDIWNGR
jgi:hypothetical protein